MAERVNTESLRYAQTVSESGSFSAAARAYGVTQPALSNGIARLERTLGEQLFTRSPQGVTLTAFGRYLIPRINDVLESLDTLSAEALRWTTPASDTIRVGVSPLIHPRLIARAYSAGLGAAPKPRELVLREANLTELRDALMIGDLDLIIIPSVIPLPRYEHRNIDSEQVVFVESKPTSTQPIELQEIAKRQLILVADTCGLTTFTRDLLASRDLQMRAYPGEALSYRVLEDWSKLGLGAALLPASRVTDTSYRPAVDDGMNVEIFYEAVWSPNSALATELDTLVQQMSQVTED